MPDRTECVTAPGVLSWRYAAGAFLEVRGWCFPGGTRLVLSWRYAAGAFLEVRGWCSPGGTRLAHFGVSARLAGDLAKGRGGIISTSWCFLFAPELRLAAEEQEVGNSGVGQVKEATRFVS
ncbi:hypothetical protein NDU88_004880 [Pleurodeles waltl]|uniref:Uncharacterized protein n=1 Tax=Pleurodeles waltl TaxID=8319 RepID=A0AAV7LL85_PLEWA|nr:hypothetical protein NDU88_004880 [Pleurodeles waltl]